MIYIDIFFFIALNDCTIRCVNVYVFAVTSLSFFKVKDKGQEVY